MPVDTPMPEEPIDPLIEACRKHIAESGATIYGHIWYSNEEVSRNQAAEWLANEFREVEKILWPMNVIWNSTDADPPPGAEVGDYWNTSEGSFVLSEGGIWVDLNKPPTIQDPDTD